jgi:DNA-binding NtrC family response regulator
MSATTNAFWREVLDYLPGFTLLFRIDAQEQTHLMFTSQGIIQDLGFTPEEYVLASEGKTVVSTDLERLVDQIAQLTHDDDTFDARVCKLTDRSGKMITFAFDFRLFQTKSQRNNLISVVLYPIGAMSGLSAAATGSPISSSFDGPTVNSVNSATNASNASNTSNSTRTLAQPPAESIFVTASDLMKEVMEQVDALSRLDTHVLLRGEKSVGKRTIAQMLAKKAVVLTSNQQVWMLDLEENEKNLANRNTSANHNTRIFAGIDINNTEESLFDDVSQHLQLVISELSKLSKPDQKDLVQLIKKRSSNGLKTRIVATSTESLESLMTAGKLDSDLYYKLSFVTINVPPLRARAEDIRESTRRYVKMMAVLLGQAEPEIDDRVMSQLVKQSWEDNFGELYLTLRKSVAGSGSKLALETGGGKSSRAGVSLPDEIIPYEEMSRRYLISVLEKTEGKIYGKDGAAYLLGMKPTTLQSKLKKLNIR